MSEANQWERATAVWDRFVEAYPGHRGGVWTDPVEGPVWVWRGGKVVTVTHRDPHWSGHFHIREPQPEQVALGL
jgi:hypothetical protein